MAVDFERKFGASSTRNTRSTEERQKVNYWINIGYTASVPVMEDGVEKTEERFISLPIGLPLDTQEHVSTRGNNDLYRAQQSARNDLLDEIMAAAEALAPGEDCILNLDIQLRRIQGEQEDIDPKENPLSRSPKLSLVAKTKKAA